ncbi:MAG: response regulator transcription factor [Bacteroidia bacterium]|nr:response regulator transcription factor [Bacteroidia bacterium]MCF8427367.1 response regulator transcription factor [Bacteroidia bacterium]MCF8447809.1 response regulator transcription factor [Bacteroidia bacterium]
MTYIAIVDDKKSLRTALMEKLNAFENYEVLFTAENGEDFLMKMMEARKSVEPDVVLMDIDMPIMNGIEAVAKGKDRYPNSRYLMLTIFDEDEKIFSAIKAGADGYLLKDEPIEKIKEAIVSLLNNEGAPMSPSIARKALKLLMNASIEIDKKSTEEVPYHYNLTPREKDVLELLVEGLEYKEIAQKMDTSPNTVRNHIANIYKKLHVTSKAQAIRLFTKNGLC